MEDQVLQLLRCGADCACNMKKLRQEVMFEKVATLNYFCRNYVVIMFIT